jgi:hypothetical protein
LKHFGGSFDSHFGIQFEIADGDVVDVDAAAGRCNNFARTSLNTKVNLFNFWVFLSSITKYHARDDSF